ncbi:ArsR/SmtB family transcription factor [Deinococcus aquaedulcis]|uniref:ArsR/SmtB family transcription factor n=1 Tax=Deinococcus aquaedulcis TaxID=2840455 RepID=UPI001C83839A|nr:winged helix-turn-helix domain-containing protein [Deinococcus aquaedulcis]
MTGPDSPSPAGAPTQPSLWQRLDDPAAARVLADAYTRQFFEPFIWRERRVGDVARELGVSKTAVLYRVRQFLRLGLLEVTRTEPRAGRAIRYYRATSRGYFVPFAATSAESIAALYEASLDNARRSVLQALTHAWSQLAEDPRWFGLYTYGDETGLKSHALLPYRPAECPAEAHLGPAPQAFLDPLLAEGSPAIWDNTTTLKLSAAEAKALQRELHALQRRYSGRKAPGQTPYLLRLTLTPNLPPEDAGP